MSKLLDKLERISEGSIQPLGFGAAVARTKLTPMLVIASIPAGNNQLPAIAEKAGADALLLTLESLDKESKALSKISQAKFDIPWGVSAETLTSKVLERLIEAGCDFAVFSSAKTPAAVLNEDKIGKVLKLDPSLPDSLARTIHRLQVEAVLLSPASDDEATTLTVHQLMVYERLGGVAGKHLLALMPLTMSSGDLESLWGIGVRGVVVDISAEQPEQRLSEIKEAILKLPTKRRKPREKMRATLPPPSVTSEKTEPDEEEEEEP